MQREDIPWRDKPVISFLAESLRGISQVVLIENAISGLIILLAISIASVKLGIIAFASSLLGTLVAKAGKANKTDIKKGLFGYNSVLTGMGLSLFLGGSHDWVISLFGAAAAAFVTAVMMYWMKNLRIPILTAPFILLTWFTLLVSYRLKAFQLSPDLVPQSLSHWELNIEGEVNWVEGAVSGIGQIFFLNHTVAGILLFAGILAAGWRYAFFAVLGNIIALLSAYWLGGEHSLIFKGLYGYNAILASIAAAYVFNDKKEGVPHLLSCIIAAFITVPVTASLDTWLLPYGLPALTMPFVLTTWMILGARKVFPGL